MLILLKSSKILGPRLPRALRKATTCGVKIRPAFKKIFDLFDEVENAARLYRKNNYDLWKFLVKIMIVFAKRSSKMFGKFLNVSRILNIPALWIYQGCEYARVLNMILVQNMSGLQIYHGSKYSIVRWIIRGYAWLCLNVPKFVWKSFVFCLPIVIPCLK